MKKEIPEASFGGFYRRNRARARWCFEHLYRGRYLYVLDPEEYPQKGGIIYAANHVSNLDPPFVHPGIPRRLVASMAKEALFKGFGRTIMPAVGAFPVMRDATNLSSMKKALRFLREGKALLIFPEGHRSKLPNKAIQPLERGVVALALKTGSPIVPVYIHGFGADGYRGRPIIVFGRPIPVSNFEGDAAEELITIMISKGWRDLRDKVVPGLM